MSAQPGAEQHVLSVASAIADGVPVDWTHTAPAADATTTAVLDQLRVIEGLSRLSDAVPAAWGPFAILAEIGHGSYGTVYRAVDPNLNLEVALKVIRPRSPLATRPAEGAERGPDAGAGAARQRRPRVPRRAGRPGGGPLDGADSRPHAAGPGRAARAAQRQGDDEHRRRHLLRAGGGARAADAARRRQGAERDAGHRRPHRAHGLRRRLRREDRRDAGPAPGRDAALPRARGLLGRRAHAGVRHLQRRCAALLPGHGHLPRGRAHRRGRTAAARGSARRAAGCATCGPTCPTPSSGWSNGPPRCAPRIAIRRPASSRPT